MYYIGIYIYVNICICKYIPIESLYITIISPIQSMVFWHWSIQELFQNSNQQHLLCQLMGIIPFGLGKNSTTCFKAVIDPPWFFLHFFGNPKAILITIHNLYYYSRAYRIAWVKHIWTPFSSLNPFFPEQSCGGYIFNPDDISPYLDPPKTLKKWYKY
jgi:hypothetical protein